LLKKISKNVTENRTVKYLTSHQGPSPKEGLKGSRGVLRREIWTKGGGKGRSRAGKRQGVPRAFTRESGKVHNDGARQTRGHIS